MGLLAGGGLLVVVSITFFVIAVFVIALVPRTLGALPVPDDAERGALADPEVRVVAFGGDEVLRLALNGLVCTLAHEDGRDGGEGDAGSEAYEQTLGTGL